jgi:uncharacterized delta-60 repeat protein
MIIELFFILLYFSIQFGGINLNISDESIENRDIRPILSAGKSVSFQWSRTWGGGSHDFGHGVAVDSLDNVYLAGYTYSFGAKYTDMVLIKYDGNGILQWNCTWGGGGFDHGEGVAVDSLDNVYLAGYTDSSEAGGGDIVLVQYDENGVQQDNQTWGGEDVDIGKGITVDLSGNVYLAGYTYSFGAIYTDMVIIKYDKNGILQWNCTWGGGGFDHGEGVAVDSLDNVYLAGYTRSFGAGLDDMVLVKYDKNGVQQWNRTWGGVYWDFCSGVAVDSSDNVYITGDTANFGAGDYDIVLVKYDGNGKQQWNRTWGGEKSEVGYGVAVDSLGNVYITGNTESFGVGDYDMVLVKYDIEGRLKWYRTWGGYDLDYGYGVVVDSLGNIYIAGSTESFGVGERDMVLVKYSYTERPPFDEFIMILIIVVSIVSVVGVGIVITYFVRRYRYIAE